MSDPNTGKRLGIVDISNQLMAEIKSGAEHVRVFSDHFKILREETSMMYAGVVECLIESSQFDEVPEGSMIPRYDILIEKNGDKYTANSEKLGYKYAIQ